MLNFYFDLIVKIFNTARYWLQKLALHIPSASKCWIVRLFTLTMCAVISQWAIFAIRNLMEQNKENQELVAAMDRRGNADLSALSALGLDVEQRDGGLLLKPTKKNH